MNSRYDRYTRFRFDRPHERVMRVTLASTLKLGAMDAVMHGELAEIWNDLDADPSVNAILVTGEGRTFSAGGDLQEDVKMIRSHELQLRSMKQARALVFNMLHCSKPIVCAARGWAVGAGLACLILSDISIMSEDAKLSDGHIKIGVAAGDHATLIWPLLCGMARAKYYLLTAAPMTGAEAARMNLISLALPDAEVEERAVQIASRLADGPPAALRWTKRTLNQWMLAAAPIFEASLALEFLGFGGPEGREGVHAFLEKRSPKFDPNVPV